MIVTIALSFPLLHLWTLLWAPLFLGIWFYKYWSFSRTLDVDPAGPPPFDRQAALMRSARATGVVRLWFFLMLSLAFVAIGVWMLSVSAPHAIFVTVVFGISALVFAAQLLLLGRKPK